MAKPMNTSRKLHMTVGHSFKKTKLTFNTACSFSNFTLGPACFTSSLL